MGRTVCSVYCLSSWGSPGKPASSRGLTPSGSRVARTFLFSLKRPEREIFRLRRLLPDFSATSLSGLQVSPAPARRLGRWFSRELPVRSGLGGAGGAGSAGPGCGAGCAPTAASLLFFLLFVSDFHQGPELPVPPLSAMAVRPGGLGRRARGRGSAAAGPLSRWPPACTPLLPRLVATGLRAGIRGSGVCWGRKRNSVTAFVQVACRPIPDPPLPLRAPPDRLGGPRAPLRPRPRGLQGATVWYGDGRFKPGGASRRWWSAREAHPAEAPWHLD